jgi:hypothetical protein
MEFNIYIKIFNTIKYFDVKPSYSIIQVKQYIRKDLKISFEFELYYNSNKITNGTIMSNNIIEDNIIILVPIMMTGKMTGKMTNNYNCIEQFKYDSLESVKDYIISNFTSTNDQDANKDANKDANIDISEKDIELNMKTKKKLEMLKKLYSK